MPGKPTTCKMSFIVIVACLMSMSIMVIPPSDAATTKPGINVAKKTTQKTVALKPATAVASLTAPSMNTDQALEILENQSFGYTYTNDSHTQRLERLENLYFGSAASTKTPEKDRIKRLAQFIINNPATSVAQTPQTAAPSTSGGPTAPLTGESRYPTVEAMEKQVFQKTFETEALEPRLARLETRVWGHPQQGALADRSDRLEATIRPFGTTPQVAQQAPPANETYYDASQTGRAPASDAEVAGQLGAIEQRYFNRTFAQEPLDTRLGRVEVMVFQSTAPEMAPSDRLYRIVGVMNAQQSAQAETQTGGSYGAPRTPTQVSIPNGYGYSTSTANPYQYQYRTQQPQQTTRRRGGMSPAMSTTLQLMFMILSVL